MSTGDTKQIIIYLLDDWFWISFLYKLVSSNSKLCKYFMIHLLLSISLEPEHFAEIDRKSTDLGVSLIWLSRDCTKS